MNRREWLYGVGLAAGASAVSHVGVADAVAAKTPKAKSLDISEYEPKSMLQVHETHIERAKYPVIDFHTHISVAAKSSKGVELVAERQYLGTPKECLDVMDAKNMRAMVNLTGGYGKGLADTVAKYDSAYLGRFYTFAEPSYEFFKDPNYPKLQGDAIEQAHKDGARGLKLLKTLGLYLRENITSGPLVKIDDKRFDPMWEAAGTHRMPVGIHTSDPEAFFLPTDRFNERYEELSAHPDWSFHGKDFPRNLELQEARNRVIARHPMTKFVALHVGDSENLGYVSECVDRYPYLYVVIASLFV